MDVLSNEGINSNSVLENTRNPQKSYQDVYAALDASVITGSGMLSVGVDVQIGEKSFDDSSSPKPISNTTSSKISISNIAQATVAPELRDLRAGQELHNRLKTASAALEGIRSSLDDISSQIDAPQQYNKNPTVRGAVENISKIAAEASYGGKKMFNMMSLYNDRPPLEVREVPDMVENEYSQIQSTIMANAERVSVDETGMAVTKGSEAFIISKSNSSKLYSFPKDTPLDEINKVIADSTEDPSIRPLIHYENRGVGELALVTRESEGPVEFASEVTISSVDGELFSVPLETYSNERAGAFNKEAGRIVEGNNSDMSISEELGKNSAVSPVSLSRESVSEVRIPNEVQIERPPIITRYDNFNERLGESVREGDGFAVTPADPGASSGSLTAGSGLRDSAKSSHRGNGFNGATPETGGDVMLLPEEDAPEPYVTLQEREAGLNGTESLDRESRMLDITNMDNTQPDISKPLSTVQQIDNGVLGGEVVTQNIGTAQNSSLQSVPETAPSNVVPEVSNTGAQNGTGNESDSARNQEFTRQVNSLSPASNLVNGDPEATSPITIREQSTAENLVVQGSRTQQGVSVQQNTDTSSTSSGQPGSRVTSDTAQNTQAQSNINEQSVDDARARERIASSGVNPVRELEELEGVVNRTMSFTLRGDRGEMDFVIASGVRVDALSLAINVTSAATGVSANAADGRLSLSGAVTTQLETQNVSGEQLDMVGADGGATGVDVQSGVSYSAGMSGQSLNSVIPESASDLSDGFELNIDLENLGMAEGRNQVYNVRSFAQTDTPQELEQNPQLARRIISSAIRQIDTLQSNIESISSVNARNTLEASDRIEDKILKGIGVGIQSTDESAAALNRVAVGINNTTSAEGGRGYGSNPLASLNLLGSVQEQSVNKRDQAVEIDTSDPAYRLATAQAAVSYGAGMSVGSLQAIRRAESSVSNEIMASEEMAQNNVNRESPVLERLADSLDRAREGLDEIRQIFDIGIERRENTRDIVQRGADRFFSNIENAKATVREQGRENEREMFDKDMVETAASQKLYNERQVQLGTAPESRESSSEIVTASEATAALMFEGLAGQEVDRFAPLSSANPDQGVAPVSNKGGEGVISSRGEFVGSKNEQKIEDAPAVVMSSPSSSAPVAVTSSTQESSAQPTTQEMNAYKSMTKLLEDKIGTVVVHGQDYTMKDIEGRVADMAVNEPKVVQTIVDKAISDVEVIVRDVTDLQTQELSDLGASLMAAFDTYGSDQMANNPAVLEHAAYVRE